MSGTYVEVGVPFFVCYHDNPDELAVRFLGRAIRNHPDLAPRGANVDFVRIEDDQRLYFRVYERGVEDETLSSGTGSISAALASAAIGKVASPVVCVARGAELTVRFRRATRESDDTGDGDQPPEPADENPQLPPLLQHGDAGCIEFDELEIEGDALPILRGEAMVQASRAPRRG